MPPTTTIHSPQQEFGNPFETAKVLRAFVECSSTIQNIVLEMAAIIGDPESDDDDRSFAFDAMMEALFPGTAADVLESYHQKLRSPDFAAAAERLRTEHQSFADRLLAAMKQKDMTQEDLAKAAGVGQPAVSNMLTRGCRPQRRTIAKFAVALGMDPTELFPEFGEMVP